MKDTEKKLTYLEKWGIKKLQYFSKQTGLAVSHDEIYILTPLELAKLKKIKRSAVYRAAIAGTISASICVIVGLLTVQMIQTDIINYLIINGLVLSICTILEFYYLFWDGLRSTNQLSHEAGLEIPEEEYSDHSLYMARAALEIPSPTETVLGVNPLRYASKVTLLFNSAAYKSKIVVTNQVIKWFLVRLFGKLHYFDLVAIPVTAFWDAWICHRILREARIRVIGPSAIQEQILQYFPKPKNIPEKAKLAYLRAIAAAVTQSENFHPNLLLLYKFSLQRLMPEHEENIYSFDIDDVELFIEDFLALEHIYQITVIRILLFATFVDGVVQKKELFLLLKLCQIKKINLTYADVQKLAQKFRNGRPFSISEYVKN